VRPFGAEGGRSPAALIAAACFLFASLIFGPIHGFAYSVRGEYQRLLGIDDAKGDGETWAPGVTGSNTVLAVDPLNPDILYYATKGGGVYRSSDGGFTWTPRSRGLPNLMVGGVGIDPYTHDVYATLYGKIDQGGFVYKSSDEGRTWEPVTICQTPAHSNAYFSDIDFSMDAGRHYVFFSAVNAGPRCGGPFRFEVGSDRFCTFNTDCQNAFSDAANFCYADVCTDPVCCETPGAPSCQGCKRPYCDSDTLEIFINPSNPKEIYAISKQDFCGISSTRGFQRSTDGGNSWSIRDKVDLDGLGTYTDVHAIALAFDSRNPARRYSGLRCVVEDPSLKQWIRVISTDSEIDPVDEKMIWDVRAKLDEQGIEWTRMISIHSVYDPVASRHRLVALGCYCWPDDNVYDIIVSDDDGITWSKIWTKRLGDPSPPAPGEADFKLTPVPGRIDRFYLTGFSTSARESLFRFDNVGPSWTIEELTDPVSGTLGTLTVRDFFAGKESLAAHTTWGSFESGDGFQTMVKTTRFMALEGAARCDPEILYRKESGPLYRSSDGGLTWKRMEVYSMESEFYDCNLRNLIPTAGRNKAMCTNVWTAVLPDPSDPDIVYAATDAGVWVWSKKSVESAVGRKLEDIHELACGPVWTECWDGSIGACKSRTACEPGLEDDVTGSEKALDCATGQLTANDCPVHYCVSPWPDFLAFVKSGESWKRWRPAGPFQPAPFEKKYVTAMAFHPATSGAVFLGTSEGTLYETADGGLNWQMQTSLGEPIRKILFNGDFIFLATGSGLYRRTLSKSFGAFENVLPVSAPVQDAAARGSLVYAALVEADAPGSGGVFLNLDAGNPYAWSPVVTPLNGGEQITALTPDPSGCFDIFAGRFGEGLFRLAIDPYPVPGLLAVSPPNGSNDTEQRVGITGTNFYGTPRAELRGPLPAARLHELQDVLLMSDTELMATVPPELEGGIYELILTFGLPCRGTQAVLPSAYTSFPAVLPIPEAQNNYAFILPESEASLFCFDISQEIAGCSAPSLRIDLPASVHGEDLVLAPDGSEGFIVDRAGKRLIRFAAARPPGIPAVLGEIPVGNEPRGAAVLSRPGGPLTIAVANYGGDPVHPLGSVSIVKILGPSSYTVTDVAVDPKPVSIVADSKGNGLFYVAGCGWAHVQVLDAEQEAPVFDIPFSKVSTLHEDLYQDVVKPHLMAETPDGEKLFLLDCGFEDSDETINLLYAIDLDSRQSEAVRIDSGSDPDAKIAMADAELRASRSSDSIHILTGNLKEIRLNAQTNQIAERYSFCPAFLPRPDAVSFSYPYGKYAVFSARTSNQLYAVDTGNISNGLCCTTTAPPLPVSGNPVAVEIQNNQPAPTLADPPVDPGIRYSDAESRVVIRGTGFQRGARAEIGGTPLRSVRQETPTVLTGVVPAGLQQGVYPLAVTNPDGRSALKASAFEVKPGSGPFLFCSAYDPQGRAAVVDPGARLQIRTLLLSPRTLAVEADPLGSSVFYANRSGLLKVDTVSALSSPFEAVRGFVPTGPDPSAIALSPDGKYAYVANPSSQAISVLFAESMVLLRTIGLGPARHPLVLKFHPNGRYVYVQLEEGEILVLDHSVALSGSGDPVIPQSPPCFIPGLANIAVTPNGSYLLAVANSPPRVVEISLIRPSVVRPGFAIPLSGLLYGIDCHPTGRTAAVLSYRPFAGVFLTMIPVGTPATFPLKPVPTGGSGFQCVRISGDGKKLYIANPLESNITVFDLKTPLVAVRSDPPIPVDPPPAWLAVGK
jgi:DNA-binding beta-propeller fold protein YncE/photosystem II stability/assembly factor-like uncharacterized protein